MYLLGVFCMVGLTVALPVLPEPPKLPYSIIAAIQNQEVHTNIPKEGMASWLIKDNNKEVKEKIGKFYPVIIPPPPELPPFDYSTLIKRKTQKARFNDAVESNERAIEVNDIKPISRPDKEEESKPVENYKYEEKDQPKKESKSAEEHRSVEEPKPMEEPRSSEEPTFVEYPIFIEDPIYVEEPLSIEEPKSAEEPKSTEESKSTEEPKSVEEPKSAENMKSAEVPKSVEEFKSEEEPKSVEAPKSTEETKSVEEPKSTEENKFSEEPKFAEESKTDEHLESSKVENKEEPEKPSEDIPVVIHFTIPTPAFISNIISKFPSLPSFGLSWPFHLPSIFGRPRAIYPNYDIDDDIYPY